MGTLTIENSRWGVWQLQKSSWTLLHTRYDHPFQVELGNINTTGQMLDTIFEFSEKSWATREDVGNLVAALDDIFDPRQNLCPGGASRTIEAREVLQKRLMPSGNRQPGDVVIRRTMRLWIVGCLPGRHNELQFDTTPTHPRRAATVLHHRAASG
jgi:hypothetical protein